MSLNFQENSKEDDDSLSDSNELDVNRAYHTQIACVSVSNEHLENEMMSNDSNAQRIYFTEANAKIDKEMDMTCGETGKKFICKEKENLKINDKCGNSSYRHDQTMSKSQHQVTLNGGKHRGTYFRSPHKHTRSSLPNHRNRRKNKFCVQKKSTQIDHIITVPTSLESPDVEVDAEFDIEIHTSSETNSTTGAFEEDDRHVWAMMNDASPNDYDCAGSSKNLQNSLATPSMNESSRSDCDESKYDRESTLKTTTCADTNWGFNTGSDCEVASSDNKTSERVVEWGTKSNNITCKKNNNMSYITDQWDDEPPSDKDLEGEYSVNTCHFFILCTLFDL